MKLKRTSDVVRELNKLCKKAADDGIKPEEVIFALDFAHKTALTTFIKAIERMPEVG